MDCRSIVETPQLACCETERYKTSIPTVLQMDLAKSRADNFRLIPANSAARDVLWVHAQSQIARTRADFERFSEMSETRGTGWWSEMDSNPRSRWLSAKTTDFSDFPFSSPTTETDRSKRRSAAGEGACVYLPVRGVGRHEAECIGRRA